MSSSCTEASRPITGHLEVNTMARRKRIEVGARDPIKRQLAAMVADAMRERHLCQYRAATRMGIDQPKVSHILHGQLDGYSMQRLIDFLIALGCDVDIVVRLAPRSQKHGLLRAGTALSS
ncbi:MAG TPA: helix-turn-helix transcriptional regulator [Gemmatimonadaceae bacterium]